MTTVALFSLVVSGSVTLNARSAGAATTGTVRLTTPTADNHPYRHGAVPRRFSSSMSGPAPNAVPSTTGGAASLRPLSGGSAKAGSKLLSYGGGFSAGGLVGAGVTSGQPQVHLVIYGSQWGTASTDGAGDSTFSNDPRGEAKTLQTLYRGLGSDGEQWSGIVTQYCDGVAVGATSCSSASESVPYPSGGVLAGVWYDSSPVATAGAAAGATGHQLALEAQAAASHFGRTSQPSNRDTQYVIASPTGSNADGWTNPTTGYCAYHDDTHDPTIDGGGSTAGPILAFTNLPYVPDAGGPAVAAPSTAPACSMALPRRRATSTPRH